MHDNQTSLLEPEDGDESEQEQYKHFMQNEPRQTESAVQIDPDTGRRYQIWSVGMTRNAKAENRRSMKVILDPIPHVIVPKAKPLQGWYKSKFEPAGVRPRPCMTDAILTEPYGGTCTVGCGFCYINHGTRGYRGQGLTIVPEHFGQDVAKMLRSMKTSAAGYFSSFIDPFLPLEEIYHNTQSGAEAFDAEGLPVFFLSRLQYPGWAYDLLKRNNYSYAQMSINTSDADDWRRLSPKAISLPEILDQVHALHKAGIYVSIQVNPIVAGIVSNDDIIKLIWELAKRGADHVIFKFVEISFPSKPNLIQKMIRQFGKQRGEAFAKLFTCNIGGQVTIDESYRLEALNQFRREAKKAKITMATCYEYKFGRDEDNRITNRAGISVGKEYLTADQCHGHRVPLFTRMGTDNRFQEVVECPPSGCLYCADDSPEGKVPCGSEYFGSAPAWELKDLKMGVYEDVRPAHKPEPLVQISRNKLF